MDEDTAPESAGADLTPRQQRFVEEYMLDLNGTQAAIRAGYAPKNAEVAASRLLRKGKVSRIVERRKAERSEAAGITESRVLRELNALAFSDVSHYQQNTTTGILELAPGAPANAMSAVSSVKYKTRTVHGEDGEAAVLEREVEFKLWDKPGAVKLAGRYRNIQGFFNKIEVTGKDGGPVQIEDQTQRLNSEEQRRLMADLVAGAKARIGQAEDPAAASAAPLDEAGAQPDRAEEPVGGDGE